MLLLYLGIAFVVGASVKAQGRRDCVIILDQDTCRQGYRCVRGQCRPDIGQPNECSMTRPCRPNYRCIQGFCVPDATSGCLGCQFQENVICENDRCVRSPGASCGPLYEPCSRGYSCQAGVCTSTSSPRCRRDRDCTSIEHCRQGVCVPRGGDTCMNNRDCTFNEECRRGRCVPRINTPECRRDTDCPYGRCQRGTCVGSPTNTCDPYRGIRCSRGYRCVNRQCLPNDEFECGPQRPCQSGYRCRMGLCVRDVNPQPTCRTNRECPPYQRCVRGNCIQRAG
ncbi:prion-like-(Q/N-rich) domain-bearing protein 25 [Magallana gigas]|uniref:prion-like-(Q/N-rich) domain-bearing protein 25 n=1 Tax=Magallana gigas TaxID=29159 RepID=UPI00333E98AC